jgi:hypothetical protein
MAAVRKPTSVVTRYDADMEHDPTDTPAAAEPPVVRTGPQPVDEARGLDFGPLDIVFATLTLPLLFWALMYAVTGHEEMYATRQGRMRVYIVLLVLEVLIVALIAWWLLR